LASTVTTAVDRLDPLTIIAGITEGAPLPPHHRDFA
jgi:hypothetical protein